MNPKIVYYKLIGGKCYYRIGKEGRWIKFTPTFTGHGMKKNAARLWFEFWKPRFVIDK